MCDGKAIEARQASLTWRMPAQYQRQSEPEYVRQLDKAIRICETYPQSVRNFQKSREPCGFWKPASWPAAASWDANGKRILTSVPGRMRQANGFGMVI